MGLGPVRWRQQAGGASGPAGSGCWRRWVLALIWPKTRDDRVNGHERAPGLGLCAFQEGGWWWRWRFRRRQTAGRPPEAGQDRGEPIPGGGRRIRRGKVLAAANFSGVRDEVLGEHRACEAAQRSRPQRGSSAAEGEAGGRVRPGTGRRRAGRRGDEGHGDGVVLSTNRERELRN